MDKLKPVNSVEILPKRVSGGLKRLKRLQLSCKKKNLKDNLEKCREEKKKFTDSFEKCAKSFKEVHENFMIYEEANLKLMASINQSSTIPLSSKQLLKLNHYVESNQHKEDLRKKLSGLKKNMVQKMEVTCNMMILKEKFDQISTLFKDLSVDADSSTKQAFQKQLVDTEDAYGKNLSVFKQTMTETLQFGTDHLDTTISNTQKMEFTKWFDLLSKNFEEMKKHLSEIRSNNRSTHPTDHVEINPPRKISQEPNNYTAELNTPMKSSMSVLADPISPLDQSVMPNEDNHGRETPHKMEEEYEEFVEEREKNNKEEVNVQQNTPMKSGVSVLADPISPLDQSFMPNEDNHGRETPHEMEEEYEEFVEEREENNKEEVNVQQVWPGKSLPVFDDLISLEESFGVFQSNKVLPTSTPFPTSDDQAKSAFIYSSQDREKDRDIVETIVSEMGSELNSPVHNAQDCGTHFLISETNHTTESQDGFLANVELRPNKSVILNTQARSTKLSEFQMKMANSVTYITCNFCHEIHESVKLLKSHLELYHSPKICQICHFTALNLEEMKHHVEIEHKDCKLCLQCAAVQDKMNFSNHVNTHKNKGNFKCSECPKTFKNLENLKAHTKKHKNLFFFCDYCEHQSISRFELQKHKAQHLSERLKQHVCEVCYAYFEGYPKLVSHLKQCHLMKENKRPDKMTCVICYLELDDPAKFINHLKNDHKNISLVTKTTIDDRSGVTRDKCRLCDMYIKNTKVRAMHMIIIHGVPPYECYCKQKFFTKGLLDFHQLNHTKAEEERFHSKCTRARKKKDKHGS